MKTFTRTDSGKLARYHFFREPLVWVEGPDDIAFYRYLLSSARCRIEPAGGRPTCQKLADALIEHDLPYVVVMDGDYDILDSRRSQHARVVLLHRYSIENYLFERETVEQVCRNYSRQSSQEEFLGDRFDRAVRLIESSYKELVELDIALKTGGAGDSAFPTARDCLLSNSPEPTPDRHRIRNLCSRCRSNIPTHEINAARAKLQRFLLNSRLVDILKGHVVLGILRRLITSAVHGKTGKKPHIDNLTLINVLASYVWSHEKGKAHASLRRRILRARREAEKIREA